MGYTLVMFDIYGRPVRVGRTQEGGFFVSLGDVLTVVMAVFTDDGFAELREMLDRVAMPGQVLVGEDELAEHLSGIVPDPRHAAAAALAAIRAARTGEES